MNTYSALSYYYDKPALESLLNKEELLHPANHKSLQDRGGWAEGLGYDDAFGVKATHYHYLSHSMDTHALRKEVRWCLEDMLAWVKVRAKQIIGDVELGEICLRVIHYDAHPEQMTLGYHVDFDFLTVPLLDSTTSKVPEPFFGQLAQDMKVGRANKHGFVVKTQPRMYVVAFVQLPMDTILPNGQRYGDRVSQLVAQADATHTREY